MKRCPITYEIIAEDAFYSLRGLRKLSPQLQSLYQLEYSASEQRSQALARVGKMSIQGVQMKLSAQLKAKESRFDFVDQQGHYILKPQSSDYAELPENEAITMTMAAVIGIDVPLHGLVYSKDNSMTYFIKRFDRRGYAKKLAVEDFAQLSEHSRDTKYKSSMENVAKIIAKYCSFPKIEMVKLLKLTLFNYLIGNEDMHLKNFSLITRDQIVSLSPAYDLVNSTIALSNSVEELALPLNGRKNNLRKKDFLDYFAREQLKLNEPVIANVLVEMKGALPRFRELIGQSFMSSGMQARYRALLEERVETLQL